MCFIIDKKKCPKALIAEKDIKVYKLLEIQPSHSLKSPFLFFIYKPNVTYESLITQNMKRYKCKIVDVINCGFHAYINLKSVKAPIKEGTYYWDSCLCEFIVPEGSEYYFNDEEIVSNRTYWTGRIYRTDRWIEFKGKITDKMNFVKQIREK